MNSMVNSKLMNNSQLIRASCEISTNIKNFSKKHTLFLKHFSLI